MSEISGIIKNGVQRGWPLQEIYQSLINSGYNPQEVQSELNKFSTMLPQIQALPATQSGQKLAPYQVPVHQEKKSASKSLVIALIILSIIVIIGGAGFILFGPK